MQLFKTKKQNKEHNLPYSESLEDITAYSWHKMIEENDVNWLRIGFNGRQPKIKDAVLDEIKKRLEDEAFKLMGNETFNDILGKRYLMNYYSDLYKIVVPILYRMVQGFNDDQLEDRLIYIRQLKELKFRMPELNSVEGDLKELERLFQQAEGLKTKVQLLSDEIKVEGSKETRSLNKDMIIVCQILDREFKDPKEISQAFWIEMQKTANEINESNKRKQTVE